MRTYVYSRISRADLHHENQLGEIEAAGYEPDATYSDTVSGSMPAAERPEFSALLAALKREKKRCRLVVTKLDRLGRDAVDVQQTVRTLAKLNVGVVVLQLGDIDLTSSAGKMILATLSAVAEIERDILVERTKAGLARAKAEGKTFGRPTALAASDARQIAAELESGAPVAELARRYGVGRATIRRTAERVRCG